MAQYGKAEYWEDRYKRDVEPFDWYQRWAGLKDTFIEFVQPSHSILMLGSGNSRLSEEMYEEGYQNLTNIDVSQFIVDMMAKKYSDKPGMTYQQMDGRALELPEGSFNVVIDKATLDSILCGEGSTHNAQKVLQEVAKVLKPDGVYVCVSHGQPSYRLTYLQRPEFGWNVKIYTVHKPSIGMGGQAGAQEENVHYIYICVKGQAQEGPST